MHYKQLLKIIQQQQGWPREEADRAVKIVVDAVITALQKGEEVPLPPLGALVPRQIRGHEDWINPYTKEVSPTRNSVKLRFRAYRKFQKALSRHLMGQVSPDEEGEMTEEDLAELERSLLEC